MCFYEDSIATEGESLHFKLSVRALGKLRKNRAPGVRLSGGVGLSRGRTPFRTEYSCFMEARQRLWGEEHSPGADSPRPGGREKIRVVRVIARMNIGGPALHASLLTDRLDPGRYESVLVAGTEEPGEGNYLALQGKSRDHLTVLPALGREIRPWRDLSVLFRLIRLIRRIRPEILHTHTAKAGVVGRLAAWFTGVPVVVHTFHGHVFQGYFSPLKTRVFVGLERWLAGRTDRILTVSETVRTDLLNLEIGTPERVRVIPLGLDLEPYLGCECLSGQLRLELGLSPDDFLVGIVARLVPIKAHEVFLEAAARLSRQWPRTRFLVVGDGECRPRLQRLAKQLSLADRVLFLGWRRDLHRVYADLDVVALTSKNEGLPVSLIEAMAAARPVVATRVGGVPDLVENGVTGLLVPRDDPESMAGAMGSLLQNPGRRKTMGQKGRARVQPAFGAQRLLRDMDRLYVELLREKGLVEGAG